MYCGQTVGCTRMPLGTEIGLGPGDIMLQGDPALPTARGTAPTTFRPTLLWHGRLSQQLLSSFCTAHGRASLYFTMGRPLPSKLPLPIGIRTPPNTQFIWLTTVTDRPTDRPRYSACNIGRIHVRSSALRPDNSNDCTLLLTVTLHYITLH